MRFLDPDHESFGWIQPSVTPDGLMWEGLPYEPTCKSGNLAVPVSTDNSVLVV